MTQTLNVKYRKVETLIPFARNPRTHSEAQVAKLAASIVEFGWTNPVLVDGTYRINYLTRDRCKPVPHAMNPVPDDQGRQTFQVRFLTG